MSFLTDEEIAILEKSPETAAVAKKLKEGKFIPKERFDEVNNKKTEYEQQLAKYKADQEALEAEKLKTQGEFKTLAETERQKREKAEADYNAEKAIADQHRAYVKAKKEFAKTTLGDNWMPEFESDSFSLESLDKVVLKFTGTPAPGTERTPPGKQPTTKRIKDMTPAERDAYIAKVNAGG